MQSFELRHTYPWSREAVWAALDSDAYAEVRAAHGQRPDAKVKLEHLSDQLEDGVRVRRVRHTLNRDIPRMMQRFTGPTVSYLVEECIDPSTFTVHWTATPVVTRGSRAVERRVRIGGVYRFEALSTDPSTCERIVEAEITVTIPGLSAKIEAGIAKSLRSTHEGSAELARRFLQEKLG